MNLEELMASTPPMQQHALIKGFQAGAASRDDEIAELEGKNYLNSNALRLQKEKNDQLRAQINDLRGALKESYPWERHFQEKCACQFCQVLAATEPKP